MQRTHLIPSIPASARTRAGALGRLANIVLDPTAAFRGLEVHQTWAAALAAIVVARLAGLYAFYTPDLSILKLAGGVLFQFATTVPVLTVLAAVLWLSSKAWRVDVTWATAFAMTAHVYFAYTLATLALATAAGALLPASVEVDLRAPPFTSPAFLASRDAPLVNALLAEMDVRSAYVLMLIWLGVRTTAPQVGHGRAVGVVATCFTVKLTFAVATTLLRG
jgi:hypothetical protein